MIALVKVPRIDSSGTFRYFERQREYFKGKSAVENSKVPRPEVKTELFYPMLHLDARSLLLPLPAHMQHCNTTDYFIISMRLVAVKLPACNV